MKPWQAIAHIADTYREICDLAPKDYELDDVIRLVDHVCKLFDDATLADKHLAVVELCQRWEVKT